VLGLALLAGCGAPDFDALVADPSAPARVRSTTAWPAAGGPGWAQHADLDLVHRGNVNALRPAWVYRSGDPGGVFQATPVLAGGRLVFCTPRNRVIALDRATGAELWRFDAQLRDGPYGNELNCRGVAQWSDPSLEACSLRILTATNDARLLAIDARSGERCADFGDGGAVDLQRGVGELRYPGEYQVVSPPAVVGDVAVVGAAIADNQRVDAPSGVVRGYSVRTGELLWAFDFAPPDFDRAVAPVSDAGWALASPNVWTHISADPERDLVFLPTGNPAPDYARPAQPDLDHYGSSVVALRASTGELAWHFQTVKSDFWDFDVPAAPALVDLTVDDETVPALVQATKMGFVFVLHRETGEPLVDVTDRAVPRGGPLADRLSPVQPFPPQAFRVSRAYEAGGSFLGLCDDLEAQSVIGPVYTPITERWTIGLPSNMGAVNWGGVAVDPRRGLIFLNVNQVPFRTRLISRADAGDLLPRWEAAATDAAREAVAREFEARFEIPPAPRLLCRKAPII